MTVAWKDRKRCNWCTRYVKDGESYVRDVDKYLHEHCETEMLDLEEGLITSDQLVHKYKRKEVKNVRSFRTRSRKVRRV
jgi:hypothetical protein